MLRKPGSVQRTLALVIAGYLLYIPANTLPVLTTVQFGREEHNTILSGVLELIHNDLWPLAVIVFTASIVLPLVKLFGLTWMLLATRVAVEPVPGRADAALPHPSMPSAAGPTSTSSRSRCWSRCCSSAR